MKMPTILRRLHTLLLVRCILAAALAASTAACGAEEAEPNRELACTAAATPTPAAPPGFAANALGASGVELFAITGALLESALHRVGPDSTSVVYRPEPRSGFFHGTLFVHDGRAYLGKRSITADEAFDEAVLIEVAPPEFTSRQLASFGTGFHSQLRVPFEVAPFAADDEAIYVRVHDLSRAFNYLIYRVARADGALTLLAEEPYNIERPQLVGEDIWFSIGGSSPKEIVRVSKRGSPAATATRIEIERCSQVHVAEEAIFCTALGAVDRLDRAGRNRRRLIEAEGFFTPLGQAGPWVYYEQETDSVAIRRVHVETGAAEFVACGRSEIWQSAFGAEDLFWSESPLTGSKGPKGLFRLPLAP